MRELHDPDLAKTILGLAVIKYLPLPADGW
jgi:hypothetical protein